MKQAAYQPIFKEVEQKAAAYVFGAQKSAIDTPLHLHSKGQLTYADHGTLYVDLEHTRYFLPVKHLIWIPPRTRHRVWSNNSHVDILTIYFDLNADTADFFQHTGVYKISPLLYEMMQYARQWDGPVKKTDQKAFTFFECFKDLLQQLGQSVKTPLLAFAEPRDGRIAELTQYIKHHLDEKLGMAELASRFGFSTRSLSRLFNNKGSSYTEYLQSLRMVRAMELMAEQSLNVNLVAGAVGYESYSAFSKVFLRYTGIKPLAYIRKIKGDPSIPVTFRVSDDTIHRPWP